MLQLPALVQLTFVAQHTAKTEQRKRVTVLQRGESSPQVWSAVLGCLIHLVSHCGYIVRGYLEGLSLKVVAVLMQCCLDHQWCDTVYCQLVRLLVNLMYAPSSSSQGESPSKFELCCSQVFVHPCSTTALMALILTSKPAFSETCWCDSSAAVWTRLQPMQGCRGIWIGVWPGQQQLSITSPASDATPALSYHSCMLMDDHLASWSCETMC